MDTESESLNPPSQDPPRQLLDIRSIFPLDLNPDRLVIDENKIVITYRSLFKSDIHSILLTDINDVAVDVGILIASIRLLPRAYGEETWLYMFNLKKADAQRAHSIITGMQVINEENTDISGLSATQLADKAASLGK